MLFPVAFFLLSTVCATPLRGIVNPPAKSVDLAKTHDFSPPTSPPAVIVHSSPSSPPPSPPGLPPTTVHSKSIPSNVSKITVTFWTDARFQAFQQHQGSPSLTHDINPCTGTQKTQLELKIKILLNNAAQAQSLRLRANRRFRFPNNCEWNDVFNLFDFKVENGELGGRCENSEECKGVILAESGRGTLLERDEEVYSNVSA